MQSTARYRIFARRLVRTTRRLTYRAALSAFSAFSAFFALAACAGSGDSRAVRVDTVDTRVLQADSLPRDVRLARLSMAAAVDENSASAASVGHPGILYTINDSGHEPELFAFDTTGADRGRWRIAGAINRDWEAVAVGRCAPDRVDWCVFIGDVGDNALRRPLVSIYRVAEPAPLAAGERGELRADQLIARYADGAHNVEAMVVTPAGALQLLTKELRRSAGRLPATTRVYELAAHVWGGATPAEAMLVDSLPLAPDAPVRYAVTDASLSVDGRVLVVRTPHRLFALRVDSATARLLPGSTSAACHLEQLREEQGEGVGILRVDSTSARLALTSEGKREPLRLVTCPLPAR